MAVAAVLVPLALFLVAAWESRSQRFQEAEQLVHRTVDVLREHAGRVFETQSLVLDRVDERIRGMSWSEIAASEELHRDLRAIDGKLDQVDNVWLIDPEARGRASSNFFPAPASSYVPDRDYFVALKQKDEGIYIGQSYPGRSNPGSVFFNIARRRSTPDGSFDGIIVTSLQPSYFAAFYRPLISAPKDTTSLIRGDGTVLARGPESLSHSSVLSQDSAFMRAIRNGSHGLYRTVSQVDGVERIYAFRKLDPYPLYVTFGHPVSAILARWHKDLMLYGGVTAAALFALLGVTAVAMRRARHERQVFVRWRESEARYEALFQQSPTGLLLSTVRDDGSFAFEEINPALCRTLGVAPEAIIGRAPRDAFPGELGSTIQDAYARCVSRREPVEYEASGEGFDGPFTRRVIVIPIMDAQGRVRKLLGTSMDITQTRQLEEQVRQMQKIEAVGQLTGGVAHDFNNLLMAVIGNLDLLRKRIPEDPRAQRYLDGALQGAQRGAALTQRLLAFARRQDLQARAVDVATLVEGIKDLLERSLGPRVKVRYSLPSGLSPAKIDPNQLELALLNLAVNARDAMPMGGSLSVELDEVAVADARIEGLQSGRYLCLRVTDTGTGMDEETLRRAVEPFFSTKGVGKGTGLGLSMVYGLAAQSGGALRLSSALGKGTTAELWLPVTEAAMEAPRRTASAVPAAAPSTILLVDDDALILMSTASMLEDLGHTVIETESGTKALEMLRAGPPVDLLLTDYAMPGMTGLELARAALVLRPDLKILLATGYADLPEGATLDLPRLPKPYTQDQLAAQIGALVGPQDSSSKVVSLQEWRSAE
ncbi:ATP-binding protein [Microvirga sp. GCM10011540]|uniref:hybrid sensor histidine kinase/response regulator n=1 Tax=Microvirga sp. GCM10011540 TaxID=3317338 RepID=UPI003620A9E5